MFFEPERRRHDSPVRSQQRFGKISIWPSGFTPRSDENSGDHTGVLPRNDSSPIDACTATLLQRTVVLRSGARQRWDIGAQTLEKPNRGYGDTPSETDVDVGTTRAFARMIDTVIEQPTTLLVPVA
jgi:hypothetical protein